MPGVGKSTVGREIAKRLDLPFADCDKVIERDVGYSIASLFESQGEQAFRDLESRTLVSLVDQGPSVIATGGGTVLRDANRELLRSRTRCVYLQAAPAFLWKRLRRDRRRPLLQVADPKARLYELSDAREPLYRDTATIVLNVESLPFDRIVDSVLARLDAEPNR